MKFVCDACGARYHIDDKKVRGKMLRIRCKKCSHVITVREPDRPQPRVVAPQPEPVPATVEWFYSVNGETLGPHDEEGLIGIFRGGTVGDEAYVWHAGFGDWRPAFEVPVFQSAISAAKQASVARGAPRTERLDALDVDNLKLESRAMGALGATDPRRVDATLPSADIGAAQDQTTAALAREPEETVLVERARPAPSDSTSSSRLEALRAGLRDRSDRRTTMTSEEGALEEARQADERAPLLDELAQSGATEPTTAPAAESPHAATTAPAPQPAVEDPASDGREPTLETAPLKRASIPAHGAFGLETTTDSAPVDADALEADPEDGSAATPDDADNSAASAEPEASAHEVQTAELEPDPQLLADTIAATPDSASTADVPANRETNRVAAPSPADSPSEDPTVEITPEVATPRDQPSVPAGEEPTEQLKRDDVLTAIGADTAAPSEEESPLPTLDSSPLASLDVSPLASLDLEELETEEPLAPPTGGHPTAPPIPAAATGGHPAAPPIPAAATGGHPAAPPIPAAATGAQEAVATPDTRDAGMAPTEELKREETAIDTAADEAQSADAPTAASEPKPATEAAAPADVSDDDDSGGFAALAASLTTAPAAKEARPATPAPPIEGIAAPTVGASAADGAPTESLVFQVKQAKSRNRRSMAVVIIGLVVVGAVAAAFLMKKPSPEPTPVVTPTEGSDDEGSATAQADEADTSDTPLQVEQSAAAAATSARNLEVAHVRARRGVSRAVASALDAAAAAAPQGGAEAANAVERPSREREEREDRPTVRTTERSDEGIGGDDQAPDRLAVNGNPGPQNSRVDRQLGVALPLPTPAFDTQDSGNDGPGAEHFGEGLRTFVENSIIRCNQRHVAEEGALEQPRVELQLTVQPSGRVTSATLPRELRDTSFGRCLQTHRERWMFPSFDGDSVTLSKTYVVQ